MKAISKIISLKKIFKKALAVPIDGETGQKMKEQGLYLIQDMLKRMPHTNQKDMHDALSGVINSGASEFFRNMKPKTVINLPEMYILDPDDIFEVNGKRYVSITVDPPRVVGQKWKSPSGREYVKGQQFEGEITALDLDTGMPIVLPLAPIKEQMIAPTTNADQILQKANKEIAKYNERIRSINNAVGVSKLTLQIARAKDQIQRRLNTIASIKQSLQAQLDYYQQSPKTSFESWTNDLKNKIQRGQLNIRDAYDTILYLNMSTPEQLVNDIETEAIIIPQEIREGVLAIARKEIESRTKERNKEEENKHQEEERVRETTIPEIHDTEIEPFVKEDIPGGKEKYKEVRTTKSLWHHIASLKNAITSGEKDAQELTKIKQSMENIEKYLGELEKGQRSKMFLNTPEGKPILDALSNFLNDSSLFIKRYATNIIQDGKVNPKLMGTTGTEGNALVAVALTRMYNIVQETIKMYTGGEEVQTQVKDVPETTPERVPIANSQDKIKKMSELLWKPFEDRMRLK